MTLSPSTFDGLVRATGTQVEAGSSIAVACSGGPDSLALTLLADAWSRTVGIKVVALVVDHRLRETSSDEASSTRALLLDRGIEAVVLTRPGPKPRANIQAIAREARYSLMRDWCIAHQVKTLMTAHHLEDQAETFLLRLARGSGVDGLGAMSPVVDIGEVLLCRPLLSISKGSLQGIIEDAGVTPVQDPSNQDGAFARVRMRNLMPVLAEQGMSANRLVRTATHMRRARAVLDKAASRYLDDIGDWSDAGYFQMRKDAFRGSLEEDTALRALNRLIGRVTGRVVAPRLGHLERLLDAFRTGAIGKGRTCAGARIVRYHDGYLICREASAVSKDLSPFSGFEGGGELIWDGRFGIKFSESTMIEGGTSNLAVGPLGRSGWQHVVAENTNLKKNCPIPAPVRPALPAVWRDGVVVAAPHVGLKGNLSLVIRHLDSKPVFSSRGTDTI